MTDREGNLPFRVKEAQARLSELEAAVGRVVVGQESVLQQLLISILAGGHTVVIGVPGLAKTLLVRTLASALGWRFRRIQFTPDLMPSDILGSEVLQTDPETGKKHFKFSPGPVFTGFLLADEINRTPPKTQAALLEAMQERQVTVGGVTYPLENPFIVVATQNPIEQEGTYPLPEAQLDRFLLSLRMEYPSCGEEEKIASLTSGVEPAPPEKTVEFAGMVGLARHVPSPPHVTSYAVRITRATRPQEKNPPSPVKEFVRWGAGPRASQHLLLCAKAEAARNGRFAATREDVRKVAKPVLRHRMVLRFNAVSEGVEQGDVLDAVLEETPPS